MVGAIFAFGTLTCMSRDMQHPCDYMSIYIYF